ncbi:MAG TPA: DUF1802 family protein [Dehalococcoidia bacterium]|nr:DUF1802 family protein [Dehalococcoidia bacterium]
MLPDRCQIALKEWAVTVRSLAQGQQVLLLRKGGIHEEGKDFRVIHPEFLLYPTYEHQREDLLKPEHQSTLSRILSDAPRSATITFSHWARATEIIEVSDQDKVDALSPHHIWTDQYARSRLHWKPMLPLSIMLLRVFRMEQPVTVPFIPEYGGCTSWVEVIHTINLGNRQPVLTDQEFQRQVDAVKGSLGLAVTA